MQQKNKNSSRDEWEGGDNVVADAVDEMWVWACLCLQKACRLLLISYAHHQLSACYTVIAISTSQPWNGNNNEWVYVCEKIKMPLQLFIAIICSHSQAVSFLPTYAAVSVWILHHGFITHNNMLTLTLFHSNWRLSVNLLGVTDEQWTACVWLWRSYAGNLFIFADFWHCKTLHRRLFDLDNHCTTSIDFLLFSNNEAQ